jgi:hypothetical protein
VIADVRSAFSAKGIQLLLDPAYDEDEEDLIEDDAAEKKSLSRCAAWCSN